MDIEATQSKFEHALKQLASASAFNKIRFQSQVLDIAARLLPAPEGVQFLYSFAPQFESAGLFSGTDWNEPSILLPTLTSHTFEHGQKQTVVLELLSELRLLSASKNEHIHPGISSEQAKHQLTQILALNLDKLFANTDESQRNRLGNSALGVHYVLQFILDTIGYEDILGSLIDEIWRILSQRPIQVDHVKSMVTQIAISLSQGKGSIGESGLGADRLVSALFSPTKGCFEDPGVDEYEIRLSAMDNKTLQHEAYGFARAMRDVGLVSDYHAIFIRWLLANEQSGLIADALGLSSTGLDALRSYQQLVHTLIEKAIFPSSAQCVYGLSMLLESGALYAPPIAPALWRQIDLELSANNQLTIQSCFGNTLPANTILLAGVIAVLGQPLGIGQGNNPTCQSARAISMWAYNDPDYLLHLIVQAAKYDDMIMHFEGQAISSAELAPGLAAHAPLDTDPVSLLLVPHLDRIYLEMGRRCADRNDDPHRWINPEFHGWWVGRTFSLAVDIESGKLHDYDRFITRFYASYHPSYNGNQPIIHPQPAGLAVTDNQSNFVGWHAISLIRVALDQENTMRMYFFNPNNDSGQDWGNGVVVSTQGYGERYGESSLPFGQMASRLYIFHDDRDSKQIDELGTIPEVADTMELGMNSWGKDRQ